MSVLNDISSTTGDAIRSISSGLNATHARRFLGVAAHYTGLHPRMEEIEYSLTPAEAGDVEMLNHYWESDTGDLNWGLPGGNYTDHTLRMLGCEQDWDEDGCYCPRLPRCTSEQRARDLLLASTLYNFRAARVEANLVMEAIVLPLLESRYFGTLVAGSAAVAELILAVEHETGVGECIVHGEKGADRTKYMKDYAAHASYYQVAASTVPLDADRASERTSVMDEAFMTHGVKYIALADLANIVSSAFSGFAKKGRRYRAAERDLKALLQAKQDFEQGKAKDSRRLRRDYEDALECVMSKVTGCKPTIPHMTSAAPGLRVIASDSCALVWLAGAAARRCYVLTREDVKSLKFVAMSHSMWHTYAATYSMEYHKSPIEHPQGELSAEAEALAQQMSSVLGAVLPGSVIDAEGMIGAQKVVPLPQVLAGIRSIWAVYVGILGAALQQRKQDYVGRYLHELFEAYTSKLGGKMAATGRVAQVAELVQTYTEHGFSPKGDLSALEKAFDTLPLTAVQDFGRLSKIVYAYDVNPIYSFIHRVKAMRKPNPIGRAQFTGDFDYDVQPHTEQEDKQREVLYRGSCRVMLVVGDIRGRAEVSVDPALREAVENEPYATVLNLLVAARVQKVTSATLLPRNAPAWELPFPADRVRVAYAQARDLVNSGTQPTDVLAGAFLDTANLHLYETRGDPDLALLKPTSLPPHHLDEILSNVCGVRRMTPVRNTDGRRTKPGGDMITAYLAGKYPTRPQAIAHARRGVMVAATSDKIETQKYPGKTRVVTSLTAEPRRLQSEFEYNNGQCLDKTPGYTVGADPGDVRRKVYSGLKTNTPPNHRRVFGSLDLASFSTGMHWDIQQWTNEELANAYQGGEDVFEVLDRCTKGTMMVRTGKNIRLASVNALGANYEGIDGKRNTFMHCALWYVARADAFAAGIEQPMSAFLYIDDGAFHIDLPLASLEASLRILRHSLVSTYVRYGFKLSILKTVFSDCYMQFLNEVYHYGIHVGYGFRALCHTGAQTFPELSTVREELAVISSGIRGAAVSGGHPFRLMAGYHQLVCLYAFGVVGQHGRALAGVPPGVLALVLHLPANAGGFGLPSYTQLVSNLAGEPEVEKFAATRAIYRAFAAKDPMNSLPLEGYITANLTKPVRAVADRPADRVAVPWSSTVEIGPGDRSKMIASAALRIAVPRDVRSLLTAYVKPDPSAASQSFAAAAQAALAALDTAVPMAVAKLAVATDPTAAVVKLVEKIASSDKVAQYLAASEIRYLKRKYRMAATARVSRIYKTLYNLC